MHFGKFRLHTRLAKKRHVSIHLPSHEEHRAKPRKRVKKRGGVTNGKERSGGGYVRTNGGGQPGRPESDTEMTFRGQKSRDRLFRTASEEKETDAELNPSTPGELKTSKKKTTRPNVSPPRTTKWTKNP